MRQAGHVLGEARLFVAVGILVCAVPVDPLGEPHRSQRMENGAELSALGKRLGAWLIREHGFEALADSAHGDEIVPCSGEPRETQPWIPKMAGVFPGSTVDLARQPATVSVRVKERASVSPALTERLVVGASVASNAPSIASLR